MRISNQQLFESSVNQMTQQHAKVAELQSQIGEGKQIMRPSDDADKTALVQRLNSALGRQDVYSSALDAVAGRLDLEEAVITNSTDILQRIKELALMVNGTTVDTDLEAISTEVVSLKDALLAQANQQDVNGNYLFSGSDTDTAAFTDVGGTVTYTGNQQRITVDISENRHIELNRPGDAIFADVDRGGVDVGFFQVIDDFVVALDTDNETEINRALSEIDSLTDSMTTSIVDIGARQRTVELQQEIIADTKLRYELLVNAETELDYTSAITELTAEMLSLEAAQASFAKISQLSLFDYIR
jgi:flagellar hook-associated protein 3 FlgL